MSQYHPNDHPYTPAQWRANCLGWSWKVNSGQEKVVVEFLIVLLRVSSARVYRFHETEVGVGCLLLLDLEETFSSTVFQLHVDYTHSPQEYLCSTQAEQPKCINRTKIQDTV